MGVSMKYLVTGGTGFVGSHILEFLTQLQFNKAAKIEIFATRRYHLSRRDKVLEIQTFPLNHRIQTQGYLIKEVQVELNMRKDRLEQEKIPLEVIHQLKAGKDYLDSTGKFWKFKEFTLPPKSLLSYAYCSDTKYDERICDHIQGSTLLYHEATFIEKDSGRAKLTFHSTSVDAAKIALKSQVKKLIMGHISARYSTPKQHVLEAKEIFKNVEFAEDGMLINLCEI